MKKKIIIIVLSILVIIIGGSYLFVNGMLGKMVRKEIPKTDDELGITVTPSQEKKRDVINIVFFGVDARDPDESSRSDSIMVVSIDKDYQKVKVTSLMRDMYVPIPGRGENRINAAYSFGGAPLAIKTINSNFGLDIRDYVEVDFFGLEKLIDKVGGVEINVKESEIQYINGYMSEINKITGTKVEPVTKSGKQILNGRQAVGYSRIRYVGNADFERTERQRRVLDQLFIRIKAKGVLQLPGIINTVLPHVETSLSNGQILDIANMAIKFNTSKMEQNRLPVEGAYKRTKYNGMYVLLPDIEQNKQKLQEFIYGK